MIPQDWVDRHAQGLGLLSSEEQEAITDFAFLWMMFEARVLGTRGSARAILEAAERWAEQGLVSAESFRREFRYFRERYVGEGGFTHHFDGLNLRNGDMPARVRQTLRSEEPTAIDTAATVLIIIYRYRNNLFHGVKWTYELRGQLDNFSHANRGLMEAIEIHERSRKD